MSETNYKPLYDAQVAEHEKTHERLREAQKINSVLRGEIMILQRQLNNALGTLHGVADNINQLHPRDNLNQPFEG